MRGTQVRILLILRIAAPIIIQRNGFIAGVDAQRVLRPAAKFIDIVAIMKDRVEHRFARQMGEGGEEAAFIIMAADAGDVQLVQCRARCGQGAGAPCLADRSARMESIPIGALRGEAGHFDMKAMRRLGQRQPLAGLDDVAKAGVGRDLPCHRHRPRRHAASRRQRVGSKPGPDHEAVGRRIARGHAQSEGIAAQGAGSSRKARTGAQQSQRGAGADQRPAIETRHRHPIRTAASRRR